MDDPVEQVAQAFRDALARMHKGSALKPIRFPEPNGAFPADILLRPPPVVVDANILRNDILRACRTGQRTVLVTAANTGLLRLFCAEHILDEVVRHSGDWTLSGPVTRERFLGQWLLEYLPLIRIVKIDEGHLAWLNPAELARINYLAGPDQDADDVPSAVLALLIQAFFLSKDRNALRAVYGDVDLTEHRQWVDVLKAGGDAGELGKLFALVTNLATLAGTGLVSGARRAVNATSPWVLVPAGLLLAGWYFSVSERTKQRVVTFMQSVLTGIAGAAIAYEEVRLRFNRVTPKVPDWDSLAETNPRSAVLGRACMHTLARSQMSDRSAAELARDLPCLGVPQGEAKVRQMLRDVSSFMEVWRGRWQLGYVAPAVLHYLRSNTDNPDQ